MALGHDMQIGGRADGQRGEIKEKNLMKWLAMEKGQGERERASAETTGCVLYCKNLKLASL